MTCQAVGCEELAPFGTAVDLGGFEIVLYLCRRHESDLYGGFTPICVGPVASRPVGKEPVR